MTFADRLEELRKAIGGPGDPSETLRLLGEQYVLIANNADAILELMRAAESAREKLKLYRSQHSGEYIGGMEYTALINKLDNALAKLNGEQK